LRRHELDCDSGDAARNKKADVQNCPQAFLHVGLPINKPPGIAGLPFN
jgi:hypothetical protein